MCVCVLGVLGSTCCAAGQKAEAEARCCEVSVWRDGWGLCAWLCRAAPSMVSVEAAGTPCSAARESLGARLLLPEALGGEARALTHNRGLGLVGVLHAAPICAEA